MCLTTISCYTKKGCHTNATRTFSVRGLLFVTACLPLSNAAIFTCVLLFTHTCPVTPAFLSLLHHPVFQHAVIAQQLSNHRLVNLPENRLFECFKRHRQLHFQRRSAVHQLDRAVQKRGYRRHFPIPPVRRGLRRTSHTPLPSRCGRNTRS